MKRYLLGCLMILHAAAGTAQVAHWQGGVSENWSTAGNWSPAAVPGAGVNVLINTWSPNPTTLSGTATPDLGAIQIGETGQGDLWVVSAAVLNNDEIGMLGSESGSTGFMLVSDPGSAWYIDHNLVVGEQGAAQLQISNEGIVSNHHGRIGNSSGSHGVVNLSGQSTWTNSGNLFVGHTGTGALDIRQNSFVFNNSQAFVGYAGSGSGSIRVREGGDWVSWSDQRIGYYGEGELSIESGGKALGTTGWIGVQSSGSGQVTVTGSGSEWNNTVDLQVGVWGSGELTIANGGRVENELGAVGGFASGHGKVSVTGENSKWISNQQLFVGNEGLGELTIQGGEVITGGLAAIGSQIGSQGSVHLTSVNAYWHCQSDLFVGWRGDGLLNIASNDAEVEVEGRVIVAVTEGSSGRVDVDGTLRVGSDTEVRAGGILAGWGTVHGPVMIADNATLAPSPMVFDALSVGPLELAPATKLEIRFFEFMGAINSSQVVVNGDLVLDGVLEGIYSGGELDPGTYFLFSYSGILTDNGLSIGSLPPLPPGHGATIDTSIDGQVLLVIAPAQDEIFSDRFE